MQFIISTPQRTHRHCIPGFGRLSLQSFPEVAQDRPRIFHTAQKEKKKIDLKYFIQLKKRKEKDRPRIFIQDIDIKRVKKL